MFRNFTWDRSFPIPISEGVSSDNATKHLPFSVRTPTSSSAAHNLRELSKFAVLQHNQTTITPIRSEMPPGWSGKIGSKLFLFGDLCYLAGSQTVVLKGPSGMSPDKERAIRIFSCILDWLSHN